ncbi:MAG: hypothetical protein C0622_09040 [Desulfuromonas sp.]|nr:MAG: hypothetical protein C0622_09040 [Desulfuromonas sp.]
MNEYEDDDLPLSRTKKKQQAKEVEEVASRLAEMGGQQFAQLELPEHVVREVGLVRSTKGRSALRRQVKHLAGVLRKDEEALESLLEQLENLDQVARGEKKQFHQLEDLRDRLCNRETFDAAFDEMLELAPGIDRNAIARLARSVHQHEDRRAYREIFKRLRDEVSA